MRSSFTAILILIFVLSAKAQFPTATLFNTASNAAGTGTLATGVADLNWQASITSSVGPWTSAVSGGSVYPGWSASPYPNCNWITFPHTCTANNPCEHSCHNPGSIDCFYKLIINLPASNCGNAITTASAYCLSLDFMADNCVYQIFLNNTSVYLYPGTNPYYYSGYSITNKVTTTICNNWQSGANTLIVHVKSGTAANPTWQGFLAQVNQTITPVVGQAFTAFSAVTSGTCSGGLGSATVTPSGGVGAYTYSWLPTGGTSSIMTNATAGIYTCVVNSGTACTLSKTVAVTQAPSPTAAIVPPTLSLCVGTFTNLNSQITGGTGPFTYTWQPGPQTTSFITVVAAGAGTTIYTLTIKDANNCTAVATTSAYSFQTPTIQATGQNLCPGQTATVLVSGANSYTWQPGNSNSNVLIVTPTVATVYTITGANNICTSTKTISVFVPGPLNFSAALSSPTLCTNSSATITLNAGGGYGGYSYSIVPATPVPSVFAASSSVAATQNYSIIATDVQGCTATTSTSIQFFQSPTLTVSSYSLCPGNSATLQASGANTYTWLPSANTATSIVVTPLTTTNYTLTGTIGSCSASVISTVVVPTALTLTLSASSATACVGNSIVITPAAAGGYGNYTYTIFPAATIANVFTVSSNAPATPIYTITAKDAFGCSVTKTISVTYFNAVFPVAASKTVCPNAPATLTVSGAQNYTWNPGTLTGSAVVITNPIAQQYSIIAQSISGCIGTTTIALDTFARPANNFNTFSITCGSLGSATVIASGGSAGAYNYTWTPTAQTGSAVSNLFPGNYTVTLKNLSNNCVFNNTVTFLPLVPLTGTLSNTPNNLCFGIPYATASIALSGGSNSQSYSWLSPTTSYTTAVSGPLAAGVNTISVTDNLTFCNVTKTFTITQPSSLTVVFTTTSNSICLGSSIGATVNVTGGTPNYNYLWNTGLTLTTAVLQESIAATYVYSFTATDANNCSTTKTIALVFVPNPTLTVSSVTICPLQPTQLNAFGATTYSWSTGAITSGINITTAISSNYTVVGSALACTTSAVANVLVKPSPTINITHNSPVCANNSLIFSATGGTAFVWKGPLNFSALIDSIIIVPALQQQSGLYTVTVTAANSCTAQLSQSLTVFANPLASTSSATVCEGSNVVINGNYVAGANYSWTGASGPIASTQNATLTTITLPQNGTYTFVVTASTGCTNSAIASISVAPAFTTAVSGQTAYCSGQSLQLSANGGNQFYWNGPNSFLSTSSSFSIGPASIANSGVYQVTATTGPCKSVQSISVTVFPLPIISGSITSPICENASSPLLASGAQSYTWQGPGYSSTTAASAQLSPVLLSHAGIFTLTGMNQNNCSASFTTQLSVIAAPTSTTKLYNACIGSPVTLSISGAQNYQWIGPNNFTSQGTVYVIPALSAAQAGTYQVTLTNTNNCSSISNLVVSAYALTLPTVAVSEGSIVCASSSKTLSVNKNGDVHQWFAANGAITVGDSLIISTNLSPGKHTYTLLTTAKNGCEKLDTLQIVLLPTPKNKLLAEHINVCTPACNYFYIEPQGLKSATLSAANQTVQAFSAELCFTKPGKNQINANITDTAGCNYQLSYNFESFEKPVADFYISPAEPLAAIDKVNLYNSSSGFNQKTWTWYLEGEDTVRLQGQNQEHMFLRAGQKLVSLLVTNSFGCSDTATKAILVFDDFAVYVPNSFSPNGDGTNDVFMIYGSGIKSTEMQIFNRWGQLIFHANTAGAGWDGTYKNQLSEQGVYTYKIRVTAANGNIKDLSGHINLLR